MSQKTREEKILSWLENEKKKDANELKNEKKKLINEIRKFQKHELIPIPKKLTLWQKIKIMILGL